MGDTNDARELDHVLPIVLRDIGGENGPIRSIRFATIAVIDHRELAKSGVPRPAGGLRMRPRTGADGFPVWYQMPSGVPAALL